MEIQRMWNAKTNHLKITQKIPEQISGRQEIKELQKTAILVTAQELRKAN